MMYPDRVDLDWRLVAHCRTGFAETGHSSVIHRRSVVPQRTGHTQFEILVYSQGFVVLRALLGQYDALMAVHCTPLRSGYDGIEYLAHMDMHSWPVQHIHHTHYSYSGIASSAGMSMDSLLVHRTQLARHTRLDFVDIAYLADLNVQSFLPYRTKLLVHI